MTIDRNDPRLRAADLSESEFVGSIILHPDTGEDLLEVYREIAPWQTVPAQHLIEPRDGYELRCNPKLRSEPQVFLVFEGQLAGVFEGDTLTIGSDHRGLHLSRELILAGFAQAPWKDIKNRKVTAAGEAALRSAYRFACKMTASERL